MSKRAKKFTYTLQNGKVVEVKYSKTGQVLSIAAVGDSTKPQPAKTP